MDSDRPLFIPVILGTVRSLVCLDVEIGGFLSKPVGESEIRSTTPSPTLRRRRKQRKSSSTPPTFTAKSKTGLQGLIPHLRSEIVYSYRDGAYFLSLLPEEFPLRAEPVMFILAGFTTMVFIQLIGSLSDPVL